EALRRAACDLGDLDGISVTSGPGLVGALLVGVQIAKSLSAASGKPLIGVNHLEGHLLAVLLDDAAPAPPWLGLVVSGGHTSLYEVRALGNYRALGHTLDDAAGEAFDKVAKLLGLPYPGGAHIDRLARGGNPEAIAFPRGLSRRARTAFDFSFSGLKTAVLQHLRENGVPAGQELSDLCASFQEAVCDALTQLGPGDTVVELGAGLGHFTRALRATGARVVAVERDRELVPVLRAELPEVEVAEADAKTFDLRAVAAGSRVVVCGNLPYHLS